MQTKQEKTTFHEWMAPFMEEQPESRPSEEQLDLFADFSKQEQ